MAKIQFEAETMYNKGDVVIFDYHGQLTAGVVTGYAVDMDAGRSIWYDIAVGKDRTLNYVHGGDIAEWDILGKISNPVLTKAVLNFVRSGEILKVDEEIQVEVPSGL